MVAKYIGSFTENPMRATRLITILFLISFFHPGILLAQNRTSYVPERNNAVIYQITIGRMALQEIKGIFQTRSHLNRMNILLLINSIKSIAVARHFLQSQKRKFYEVELIMIKTSS